MSVLQLRSVHCILSNMPLGLQRHGSEYGVHIICSMPVLCTGSVRCLIGNVSRDLQCRRDRLGLQQLLELSVLQLGSVHCILSNMHRQLLEREYPGRVHSILAVQVVLLRSVRRCQRYMHFVVLCHKHHRCMHWLHKLQVVQCGRVLHAVDRRMFRHLPRGRCWNVPAVHSVSLLRCLAVLRREQRLVCGDVSAVVQCADLPPRSLRQQLELPLVRRA